MRKPRLLQKLLHPVSLHIYRSHVPIAMLISSLVTRCAIWRGVHGSVSCPIYSVLSLGGCSDSLSRAPGGSWKQCLTNPGSVGSHMDTPQTCILHCLRLSHHPCLPCHPCASCPWDVASVMLHAWLYMAANETKSFLRESQKASQLSGEPSVGEFWAGRQESSYHSICSCWTKYKPVQESSVATYSQKGWSRRLNFVNSSTWKDFKETIAKHLKEVFQKCIRKETFSRRSR